MTAETRAAVSVSFFEISGRDGGDISGSMNGGSIELRLKPSVHDVEQIFEARSWGEFVVFARAVSCCWDTLRSELMRLSNKTITPQALDDYCNAYSSLSREAALATLQFYRMRAHR